MDRGRSDELAAAARPFTAMGSATLHLDALQGNRATTSNAATTTNRKRLTAGASSAERQQPADGDFDVRKFILEQKGSEPLHHSSLFRAAPFLEHQQHNTKARASPRSSHGSSVSALTKRSKALLHLPKMELAGPKSVGALSEANEGNRAMKAAGGVEIGVGTNGANASVNQPHDDEYDTVSHFYTIEKLAESCCHAAQSRNKTWYFLPGSEERAKGSSNNSNSGSSITGVERPSRRVDVLDLDRCFDTAMQFVHKKSKWDSGGGATNEKLAMIDRDLMSIEARVAHKYAVCDSSTCSDGDNGSVSTAAAGTTATSDTSVATESNAALVKLFFEQKWSDVVLGELEAMLTVSFLEQGVLLRKARIQYARAFYALEALLCTRSGELTQALQTAERMRHELLLASASHARDTDAMKQQYEAEIARLSAGFEAHKDDMERKVGEAKEQMTKMGDTMKTLNTIFRQMREDTEKVKAVELRESYNKLEKKHELCREELERLRPLVAETQRLVAEKESVELELAALKDNVANMTAVLAAKDDAIAALMEQQSDMLAAQELRDTQDDERRKQARDDVEDDDEDDYGDDSNHGDQVSNNDDNDGNESSSVSTTSNRARRNSVGVCVRCKKQMREQLSQGTLTNAPSSTVPPQDVGADDDASDANARRMPDTRKRRIQCLHFRILLPNLRGRRPQREIEWTLSCMRSIVFAKQIDDAMCKRTGGAFPLRIRMPEFVYAWYAPWRSIQDEREQDEYGGTDNSSHDDSREIESVDSNALARSRRTPEQQQMQADEDRWCLYYGVKALVHEGYLEAKLFLSLLDEKYGEDELVFMLYCYRVLDIVIGGRLHWGPLRECVSYAQFAVEYDQLGIGSAKAVSSASRVPKTIWISPQHASLATGVVLAKATASERAALDKKILNYIVTNVPQDERPTVFIPSEQLSVRRATKNKAMSKQKAMSPMQSNDDNDDSNDNDEVPQQFVDANLWVELMMLEYKEEQAHRRAAIRLMFQTATGAAVSSTNVLASRGSDGRLVSLLGGPNAATMDMEQFRVMVRTLNDRVPSFVVARLFRDAYVRGGGGVHFDAFMDVAESAQFFSSCMRLGSPAASMTRNTVAPQTLSTSAALSTSARATHVVERFFARLREDVAASVAALPLLARSVADELACDVAQSLADSDGAALDGVRLLASFHRLVDNLLLAKLVQHEVTGDLFHSKTLSSMERALTALLACVRLRDRSSVEILVDAVRQKVCVQRMQTAFRAHLHGSNGAPLAMRTLLHCSYARRDSAFRDRRAVRPLAWLLVAISAIVRQSLQPERHALLVDLSRTSAGFHVQTSVSSSASSTLNGGIGPAPRPVLMELIYDFFLDKFGTRWEAEKLVHDVFVSCRAHAHANATVALFSALCSMHDTAAPDDRLLGQNEALAFLHSVLRCGLHSFSLVNPTPFAALSSLDGLGGTSSDSSSEHVRTGDDANRSAESDSSSTAVDAPVDYVPLDVAEAILLGAFSKLDTDQKSRLRARIEQAALESSISTNTINSCSRASHVAADRPQRSRTSSSIGSFALEPLLRIEAGAFLLLALTEWKRYVVLRMQEVKIVCGLLEDEMRHFAAFQQLEAIANVLQKCDVVYGSDDVCVLFRRFCSTDVHVGNRASGASSSDSTTARTTSRLAAAATTTLHETASACSGSTNNNSTNNRHEPVSDRLAAAFFPVLAREPLAELHGIENSAIEPFKIAPNPAQSYALLMGSWHGYREPCRQLLEALHRVGKSNDIQAESVSRRSTTTKQASTREVLYLSSSASADRLSSQDVAQLEAVYVLFLDRMDRLETVFANERAAAAAIVEAAETQAGSNSVGSKRGSVVSVKGDGSLALVDDMHAHAVMVNETWKIFRQVLLGFTRLRSLATLGAGSLPDVWTTTSTCPSSS